MIFFVFHASWPAKINFLLILGYWNIGILNIQLIPKIVYGISVFFMLFHKFYDNLIPVLVLIHGVHSPIIMVCAIIQIKMAQKLIKSPEILGTFMALTGIQYFYTTGHRCNIQSLIYSSAFIGFDEFQIVISGLLLSLNTLSSFFACIAAKTENYSKFLKFVMLFYLVAVVCTLCNTLVNCRHLMVWSVFAPKFLFDIVFFVVVWILCLVMLFINSRKIKPKE